MILKQKYVVTKNGEMIVFSELLQHSEFSSFEPVSAGFLSINAESRHEPTINCYGKSVSLKLDSREIDTKIAESQILGNLPY